MFDASDPKTSAVIDPMLANGYDVKHGMQNVGLKQVITDVSLLNVSDTEHIMAGVEQYGLKFKTKLVGFEDEDHHEVKLLRQDGADVADIDLSDSAARDGDSTIIYHLDKDEVNKLNDAGLYEEPKETLTDLKNSLLGEEIHAEGAVRVTTFKTRGHNFEIGQKRSVENEEFECGLVSSMGYVTMLDKDVEEQDVTDKLNTAILDVVSGLSLRKQAREERKMRQAVKYEAEQILGQDGMDDVDTYDENKEDKMHLTIANEVDLSGKHDDKQQDVETEKSAKDAPEINVETAVDLNEEPVDLNVVNKEDTKTLEERSTAPASMKGKTFAQIQADQQKRLQKLREENKARKQREQEARENNESLEDDAPDKRVNEADKIANENLQRTIQTTVADDIDSSTPDADNDQFDDEVSQFESEEEKKKRLKNQAEFHTKRVDQTEPEGPEHRQARLEKLYDEQKEIAEKQSKKIRHRQKENDGPEM